MKNSKAFTLTETMIVLVVLGLVAALTVPNLINKQKETTQRTKVKKAMATYETAINKMLLEHDRSFDNLNSAGCDTKTSYFKYIKRDTTNTCIFQSPDKLWWDVSNIERPMIAFEQSNLTVQTANAADNKDAFVMVGRFDDQGILRVDDLAYETQHSLKDSNNYESKAQLEKLYGFAGISNEVSNPMEDIINKYCNCSGENCCKNECLNETVCLEKNIECTNINATSCSNRSHMPNINPCNFEKNDTCTAYNLYQRNGDHLWLVRVSDDRVYIRHKSQTGLTIICEKQSGNTLYCQRTTPGNGNYINGIKYDSNGDPIAYYNYDREVCTRNSCNWPNNPFDLNIKYGSGNIFSNNPGSQGELSESALAYKIALETLMK